MVALALAPCWALWGIWGAESREDCIEIECLVGREIEREYGKGKCEPADFVKRFERRLISLRSSTRKVSELLPAKPRSLCPCEESIRILWRSCRSIPERRLPVLSDLIFAASDRISFRPTSKMSHDAGRRDSCESTRHDGRWRWLWRLVRHFCVEVYEHAQLR